MLPTTPAHRAALAALASLVGVPARSDQPLAGLAGATGATGAGVTVYLVDSGIRTTHREFAPGRAVVAADFVGDDRRGADCHGHGTHVAGVVGGRTVGVAPGARLVALRVADCRGTVRAGPLLAALAWLADSGHVQRPAVVNYSLGADVAWTEPEVVAAVEDAVRRIVANGVPVVAAAGNEPTDACRRTPARVGVVITVSAVEATDGGTVARSRSASWGPCVALFAPGDRVASAGWRGDTDTRVAGGTSTAAAFVSGVVALYLECHPTASPAEVRAALLARATVHAVGRAGPGSPDRRLSRPGRPPSASSDASAARSTTPPTAPPTKRVAGDD